MDRMVNNVITFVYSVFIIITFSVFIFSDSFSAKKFCIITVITAALVVFTKFQILKNLKVKRTQLFLLITIVFSIILRISWVYLVKAIPLSDFYTYHTLAGALADGDILYPKFISLFPHVFGYSRVLSVVYSLFGQNTANAVVFNIVLNIGILLLIYYIAKTLYDEKTGLVAAIIYTFWPSQIFYNSLVLTEPFFTFGILLLIAFYLYVLKCFNKTVWKICGFSLIGVMAGCLKYIRPAAIILVLSFIIHFLLLHYKHNPHNKAARKEIIVRVGLCILLICTYSVTSKLILNSIEDSVGVEVAKKSSGFYILAGLNIESEGRWSLKDSSTLEELIAKGFTSEEIHQQLTEMGINRLKSMDLFSFLKLQINKNKHMWGNDSRSIDYIKSSYSPASRINISKHAGWLVVTADSYYFFFLALSCAALFIVKSEDNKKETVLNASYIIYLYILGTVAAHMLVEVHSRYHYPVIPLICVPAALLLTRTEKIKFNNTNRVSHIQ